MKKTAIAVAALALGAVALAGTSCSKTETHEENVVEISSNYSGTLTCTVRDTDYPSENIKVSVAEGEEDQTIVITMYKVRFVPQMPVEMTFNIGPIKCSAASDGTVTLSADGGMKIDGMRSMFSCGVTPAQCKHVLDYHSRETTPFVQSVDLKFRYGA